MNSNAAIHCKSLRPTDIEPLFNLCWDSTAKFTAASRAMSSLEDDVLPDDEDIQTYIQNWFTGKRLQPPVNITLADIDHLPAPEILDLLYRNGDLSSYEAWLMNRINQLINSRRVFTIACLVGFRKVIDCFIEMHAREWFGPLVSLIPYPAQNNLPNSPYMVSAEGSAKKIADTFFLHSGTNNWNRAWLPTTVWDSRWDTHLRNWQGLIKRSMTMAEKLKAKNFQFLLVPEKDTIARTASPGVFQSGLLPMALIQKLMDVAATGTLLFPVIELANTEHTDIRLKAGDSHLSAHDYWTIFQLLLSRFGLQKYAEQDVTYDFIPNPGDLGSKFNNKDGQRQTIDLGLGTPDVVGGQTQLQIPLRDNYVHFKHSSAPIQKSLLILGDSHSSTGANPFLTYIASHFFSHVEFFWNPFDVHGMSLSKMALTEYDYILFETSQRFATPAVE